MTIVLHWWAGPIIVIVAAVVLAMIISDGSTFDFLPALIVLGGLAMAIGITVGHFL